MSNDNKLTIGLVVVVGVLAVVAIVISAVSLGRNTPPTVTVNNPPSQSDGAPSSSQGQGQGQGQIQGSQQPIIVQVPAPVGSMASSVQGMYRPPVGPSGRIYSLAIGHEYGPHGYFDNAGYLSGFGLGLIDLVCETAEIDCRIIWDTSTNCWDSVLGQHATGGQGLHARWYDGCTGWYTTVERSHVFAFSQPYLKEQKANFFLLPGKTLDTTKEGIMKSKIVYLDGWATDEKCMARVTGAIMHPPNIVYVKNTIEAIELLNNGYDTIFVPHETFRAELKDGSLITVGPEYSCMLAGSAIMSRKDNDLPVAWNRGFVKLKNDGRFKKYCEVANAEHIHKGTMECIDSN